MTVRLAIASIIAITGCAAPPAPAAQNPSPMVEHTRVHARLDPADTARGLRFVIDDVLPAPVHVFVPQHVIESEQTDASRGGTALLIHFHGASFIVERAVTSADRNYVAATVNLGAGSSVYGRPFADATVFDTLVRSVSRATGRDFDAIVLSGFSAGYGAIRAILRDSARAMRVEGILLLDGLHTGYIPDGVVLHDGGRLDTTLLEPFVRLARDAVAGRTRFLMTHSEIFPGTFASTTETADYIIESLGVSRTPVLKWGPAGMQQLSSTRAGALAILGFAGNTAPDHIDHLHALPVFLELYNRLTLVSR